MNQSVDDSQESYEVSFSREVSRGLSEKIQDHSATVGVIGLGYVGLPIAQAFSERGFSVLGFDVDPGKIDCLMDGRSYLKHIPDAGVSEMLDNEFTATADYASLPRADAILVCVPTPLDEHREPDTQYIEATANSIAENLREGQLVVLESTSYPGTTRELMRPILENSGLRAGEDFFLGYSPEREDPGNATHSMADIPKVVAGFTQTGRELTQFLYDQVVVETVPVSTLDTAEATKLLENIYRSVNIALVNELKTLFHRMNIDVFEVIEAAKTKPFGFKAFYPGPGLGGHCIPVDPFYLSWKARQYDHAARFIHLAGEINTSMPYFVVDRVAEALNKHQKPLNGSDVLLLGMSYKENVGDLRESPSYKLMDLLEQRGASVDYSDPYFEELPPKRRYDFQRTSVSLCPETVSSYDCVLLCTAHRDFDYELIKKYASLVVDTRNIFSAVGNQDGKVYKA